MFPLVEMNLVVPASNLDGAGLPGNPDAPILPPSPPMPMLEGTEGAMAGRMRWWGAVVMAVAACGEGGAGVLGAPCALVDAGGAPLTPVWGHDLVQTGRTDCDDLICASFSGSSPVCTRPCTRPDECPSGWRCAELVLTRSSLESLRQTTAGTDADHDGVDDFTALTGNVGLSTYCAPQMPAAQP